MADLYTVTAFETSKRLTENYSTSFSSASKLFSAPLRPHIYNIYGLVRIADEIVDTYKQKPSNALLNDLEKEVYEAIERGYSTNLIVHAFAVTAAAYGIGPELIKPFFDSMRIDAPGSTYKTKDYQRYIHGSAEVVGLMCLRVFCQGDKKEYAKLKKGAQALGSAFQKVNFLRDIRADHLELGRYYFPIGSYDDFDDDVKNSIITDITEDFLIAKEAIDQLPPSAKAAVKVAYHYYLELLDMLRRASAAQIKQSRLSVPSSRKIKILAQVKLGAL